ncbi:MAG: GNAT family N-acetyltransferase [Bacteroidales bacterium]
MIDHTTECLTVTRLSGDHAEELTDMLLSAPAGYSQYFTPFEFSLPVIRGIMEKAEKDHYYGIRVNGSLAGIFMLRGLDKGFPIPAFGVWIAEKFQGLGLSKLAIQHSISVCRLNKINKLMLKVYPGNEKARKLYERMGFVYQYVDEKNANLVYYKELN